MNEERTYPRQWFTLCIYRDEVSARTFVRETAASLFDESGRRVPKSSWRIWYPTLEEAQAVIDARVAKRREDDADKLLRDAAPKLLEALEGLELYLRNTPHHNAMEAAAARAAIRKARGEGQ